MRLECLEAVLIGGGGVLLGLALTALVARTIALVTAATEVQTLIWNRDRGDCRAGIGGVRGVLSGMA